MSEESARVDGVEVSNEETVLSLTDVSVEFETGGGFLNVFSEPSAVRAVDNVSLDIPENDVVAIVGESGCGKTTLGKTAIGLQRPTSGTISYRGQDMWAAKDRRGDIKIPYKDIRRSLQIIHQDPGSSLNPYKRVISTLSMPLKKWQPDLSREDRHARIQKMLETVEMTPAEDYAERYPHQLSGGEKQRVALIRALLMNPDVVLADEAVSALDVSLRVEMMDLLLDLQNRFNTSFLFISHDLSNARYLAEHANGRIGVMYLGEIVEIGPVQEVIENPQHPYTKALKQATADIHGDSSGSGMGVRKVDIPDAENPPSGCRFHTRCPEAREICTSEHPEQIPTGNGEHKAACYRADEDHPYWESESITD